ncbi:MAG: heme-binding protein [Planctomycetaceae bacterium]|nr:heme-binding protein [Planctomycetaceae bacterium]
MTVRKRMFYLLGFSGLVVLGTLVWSVTARAGYESAPYKVIESAGNIEIREYPDLVLASTQSNPNARGRDGSFMKLFRYISGNNNAQQKIEMTTPVFMEEESEASKGKMGFVMPQKIVESGAPSPQSDDVTIRTREGGRFAVIRFSGVMDDKLAESQEAKLREWMTKNGYEGVETAERAGYDPPFKPGPLRRNEILIRLQPENDVESTESETAGNVE